MKKENEKISDTAFNSALATGGHLLTWLIKQAAEGNLTEDQINKCREVGEGFDKAVDAQKQKNQESGHLLP
jgi:hypothetical protein